jgi:RNA polymerase sigma-70 factor (ECF subfamily)
VAVFEATADSETRLIAGGGYDRYTSGLVVRQLAMFSGEYPDSESQPAHRAADPRDPSAAFDALVRAHYARLAAFAYRYLSSREAAEDAVQEVLLKVWERGLAQTLPDPLPYLYQATRNQCLMVLRHQRRWQLTDLSKERLAAPEAADAGDPDEVRAAVDAAIAALPERTRLVFSMSREQKLTYAEIARILGISTKTVENQMSRALRHLRRSLGRFLVLAAALVTSR